MSVIATWYVDVISPYLYLQLDDLSKLPPFVRVVPKPILLAGLLNHWGHKGPAEIPPKRLHTYRQCVWLARARGLPFTMPPRHPFNPLPALRLLCALGPSVEQVQRTSALIFGQGQDVSTAEGLQALGTALGVAAPEALATDASAKAKLRANTDEALACGVWGVPTFMVGDNLFWGADSFAMMLDYIEHPTLFDSGEMLRIAALPIGASRI